MIRRLSRLGISGLCLLSLLASLGAGWLWWRSYRTDRDQLSFRRVEARYTIRSEGGRVTVWRPPPLVMPPAWPAGEPTPRDLAAAIRNDQIVWEGAMSRPPFVQHGRPETPAAVLAPAYRDYSRRAADFAAGEARRLRYAAAGPGPLLAALEDPNRFVAAHVLLGHAFRAPAAYTIWYKQLLPNGESRLVTIEAARHGTWTQNFAGDPPPGAVVSSTVEDRPDGTMVQTVDGLRAEFTPTGSSYMVRDLQFWMVHVGPAQIPALREQWHRRLDVPVASVRHGLLVAATALPPLIWSGVRLCRALARKRRRRMGLCVSCGRDLRGSAGRCGECEEAVATKGGRGTRRVADVLLGTAAAGSLLLCVTFTALWVRSYRTRMAAEFWRTDGLWEVASEGGRVWVGNEPQRWIEQDDPDRRLLALDGLTARLRGQKGQLADHVRYMNETRWEGKDDPVQTANIVRLRRQVAATEAALVGLRADLSRWPPRVVRPLAQRSLAYPLPVAATALLPALWLGRTAVARRRRRVRLRDGLCVECGYDLRATGNWCPECGHGVAPKVES